MFQDIFKTATRRLTQSEIQNLGTSRIEIIPAQGAGRAIAPLHVTVTYKQGTAVFTGGVDNIGVFFTSGPYVLDEDIPTDKLLLTDQGVNAVQAVIGAWGNSGDLRGTSTSNNDGVSIGLWSGSGMANAGTGAYMDVCIQYVVIDD